MSKQSKANDASNKQARATKLAEEAGEQALHGAASDGSGQAYTGLTPNYREDDDGKFQDRVGVSPEFTKLFELDPSEVILAQATRHPFGMLLMYALGGVIILALAFFAGIVSVNSESILGPAVTSNGATLIILICLALMLLTGLGSILAAQVYMKSRMIITNQKLVLIQYHSLFSREVSQLNISDVEDINVSQPNIMDRLLRSGVITIETAGEQNNYMLTWIKDPYEFTKKSIQAHEGSIAEYGN